MVTYNASLHLQQEAKPPFFKPPPVPFAIRDAVGKELHSLEQHGIVKKVSNSDRAAPIVAVPKKDAKFRICGDYMVTINLALATELYPLSNVDYIFGTLAKERIFSKLNFFQTYVQLQLDDNLMPYLTINTS